ncbi:MAG: hypothetical protein MK080_04255 [Opitutales bacterium]|jgi:transposase-like protein|nr:hypothetical protein [Opitutales bacterium]
MKAAKKEKIVMRYSEAFQQQVVREIETGRFSGPYQAATHYEIRGADTIARWIKKFGKNPVMTKVVRVEKQSESNELQRLRERVRQLEKAVADQFLSHEIDKSYLEIACERAGIDDIDDFKKKVGGRRGNAPRKGSQTNTDV